MEGQQFKKKTKISKSKDGEAFSPERIMKAHCADAIRLWCAGATLGTDIHFEEESIKEIGKFLNKLWNATKFGLMQLEGFTPDASYEGPWNAEDLWIQSRFKEVNEQYQRQISESFELHAPKVVLDKFFWILLCDNYIEYVKCRLQDANDEERASSLNSLYRILLNTLKLYAPFAPHITEEIYQLYFKQYEKAESLHLLKFPAISELTKSEKTTFVAEDYLLPAIGAIRQYKTMNQLPFRVEAEKLTIATHRQGEEVLEPFKKVLRNFAQAKEIEFLKPDAVSTEGFQSDHPDLKIILKISDETLHEIQERKKQKA